GSAVVREDPGAPRSHARNLHALARVASRAIDVADPSAPRCVNESSSTVPREEKRAHRVSRPCMPDLQSLFATLVLTLGAAACVGEAASHSDDDDDETTS